MVVTLSTDDPVVRDEGSIIVLQGTNPKGEQVSFGADHRQAQHILHVLDIEGEIECLVEDWQILSRTRS